MAEMIEATKQRNYNVDDDLNRDWLKLLLRLRAAKKEITPMADNLIPVPESVVKTAAPTLFQRVEQQLAAFGQALKGIFESPAMIADAPAALDLVPAVSAPPTQLAAKAEPYTVQPFHDNFALADETARWSFDAADGNALLDKGGWDLYKRCHLVCDTTDGITPEKKAAYTYPVAKLVDGQPTYFLRAAQTVYGGLRGGARAADLPLTVAERVLRTVKRIYTAFGKETEAMALKEISSRAFAFKALDGTDWWMQWTTNAFADREQEIFTTRALEDFVERHRESAVKGEFWYRHIPGTKFGTVQWQALVGRFLVQAGPFDATPVGQAFKVFFQQYPDGHPVVAPEGWGTSHGYQYKAVDREDGVYEWVEIQESTVLPLRVASNPWSPHPRIVKRGRGDDMNETERKELERIGGAQLVALVEQEGEARTKHLERAGVGFKGLKDAMAMTLALMEAVEDEAIREALSEIYAAMEAPEDASEMEAEAELPPPAEDLPPSDLPEAEPLSEMKGLTREEVADALTAVTHQLRNELQAQSKAITEGVAAALLPLTTAVAQLQTADAAKIAEKAAATPAASLRELVQSALERQTALKSDDPLLEQRPRETPLPAQSEGGLPTFLAQMLRPQQ